VVCAAALGNEDYEDCTMAPANEKGGLATAVQGEKAGPGPLA
jgi:hypothetical protein